MHLRRKTNKIIKPTHHEHGYDFRSELEYVPAAHWQEQRRVKVEDQEPEAVQDPPSLPYR